MILLTGLFISLNPQETIINIRTGSSEIAGRMLNSIYQQDKPQLENLISILNLDVLEYYNLKNEFNTDSKREACIESEEYKARYSKLKELRAKIVATTYH